jgi:hypothetical protein
MKLTSWQQAAAVLYLTKEETPQWEQLPYETKTLALVTHARLVIPVLKALPAKVKPENLRTYERKIYGIAQKEVRKSLEKKSFLKLSQGHVQEVFRQMMELTAKVLPLIPEDHLREELISTIDWDHEFKGLLES